MTLQNPIKIIVLIVLVSVLVTGCDKKNKDTKPVHQHIVTATIEKPVKKLFYTGTLTPINTAGVVSPVAGNVVSIHFSYGERIKEGQLLLVVGSKTLSQDYRKAVSDFLQKKQAYITGKLNFSGTQALYKAGVVAKNDFVSAKNQFDNSALDYLQAQYELKKVLKTANVDYNKIALLSLSDTSQVNDILDRRFQHINIDAPSSGIALYPLPSNGAEGSKTSKLMVGDAIKEDQLMLTIGDLSGLGATLNVSEVDIDNIHKNMAVQVKGDTFKETPLKGYISAVSEQANQNSDGGGGLSMFSVSVKVPNVSLAIMSKIRVGMTAKFEIDIQSPPRVLLPINAVFQKNEDNYVTVQDAGGVAHDVPVTVGTTTATSVTILKGVKAGDRIVVND